MNCLRCTFLGRTVLRAASLFAIAAFAYAQNSGAGQARSRDTVGSQGPLPVHESYAPAVIGSGSSHFQQNCGFCHGRDAGGGESGPDLTRSKVVSSDMKGENIGAVIRNGRPEKGMPRFNLPDAEVTSLVAFIHSQQDKAMSQTGTRKGVDESDLQTGDVEAGKQYFNGVGTCVKCHSPTGDLSGIASRYHGLKLEQQMLYPRDVKSKVTVTETSGKVVTGQLAYHDEFTVALIDSTGRYRSWPTINIKYKIVAPADAHIELLGKYSDADIHNLLAYMQTLR
jgi:cytochrome c oxidase cbb3-type subunit 3